MFFSGFIQRKISSLLQPWLMDEPQLELKLGFLRSHGAVKNLRFDTSTFNQLFHGSSRVFFEDFTVEVLIVRISNWSVPAFTFEVHGVHATLSLGESSLVEGRLRVNKSTDTFTNYRKRSLSMIDPEGSALHGALERILLITSLRNRCATSLLNVIIKNCQLQMHGINVQVQYPGSSDCFACLLEIKDIGAEQKSPEHGCFLGQLVSAVFIPVEETNFILDSRGFEIRTKCKDYVNSVFHSADSLAYIKLKHLQLLDIKLCVPESTLSFSPVDLPILLAFSKLSSNESKRARNGRQLWEIAASRVCSQILAPRAQWYNLVGLVCLWLQYVDVYKHLLVEVGYPAGNVFERSTIKMMEEEFSRHVKHQWNMLSEIERKLPVKAIAQARRIARYRAALKVQHAANSCTKSEVNDFFKVFLKILYLLGIIWKVVHSLFWSLRNIFFLRKFFVAYSEIDENLGNVSDDYCSQLCFTLNLGKISLILSSTHAVQHHVNEIREAHAGISNLDLLSFCLSIDALLLIYAEGICKQSFSVACGQLTVTSSSVMEALTVKSNSRNFINSLKGKWNGKHTHPNSILWGEPAKVFLPSGSSESGTANCSEGACAPFLENTLREMWLTWKKSCTKFEVGELRDHLEHPCILCEIKNDLIDPGLKGPDAGSWRCSLTVGKLNFSLGHSSILSIAALLRQAQHAFCCDVDNWKTRVVSHSSRNIEDPPEINLDCSFKHYVDGMETSLLRMLPEKHVQVVVHIAGPHIQVSLGNDQSQGGLGDENHILNQDDLHLSLNFNNIEVALCPTFKSDLTISGCPELDCAEPQCLQPKEHHINGIIESNNGNYVSKEQIALGFYLKINGVNAGLQASTENQQCQICVIEPILIRLCTLRKHLHSFSTNIVAVSAALCGMATGSSVSLYMDELSAFFQAILVLISKASNVFTSVESVGCVRCQDLMRRVMALAITEETQTTAEGACSVSTSICFIITGRFQMKLVDLIFHNSRRRNYMEGYMNATDALASKKFTGLDVPDHGIWMSVPQTCFQISCDEERLGLNFDMSEFQSFLFRYQNKIGETFCLSECRNGLLESINCLYEISLSNCTFTLLMDINQSASCSGIVSNALDGSASSGKTSCSVENSCLPIVHERLSVGSPNFCQKLGFTPDILAPSSSHWLLIHIALGEIFMCSYSMKGVLVGVHQPDKLLLSLSVGEEFQTIYLETQGGFLFLEIIALVVFAHCFASYLRCISNLLSTVPSFGENTDMAEPGLEMTGLNFHSTEDYACEMLNKSKHVKWKLLEACIIDLAQFSLVLVAENESGGVEEIVLEANVCLKLELGRKFHFDLSRLSVFSQNIYRSRENEIPNLHFSPGNSNLSTPCASKDLPVALRQMDGVHPIPDHASCSSDPVSQRESSVDNCASGAFRLSDRNCILKQLNASFSLDDPLHRDGCGLMHTNQVWVGCGFVSGFDITISLSEVQIISSMVVSFSEVFGKESSSDVKQKNWPSIQEYENTLEEAVPNGSIVAVQDVHQHMYITVEGVENKYSLVGAVHYSLVGERALFRVKYHSRRRWRQPITWFSLISLYAKSDSGEPLRLNFRPGSGFVDISMTDDGGRALWRALPCKPKSYEGDIEWEPFSKFPRNVFCLMNKKNDCAIAFVDEIPEFVKKPGNPFKFKVFHNLSVTRDVVMLNSYPLEASGSNLQPSSLMDSQNRILPHIEITFDKVTLIIVHELPDTKDKFPLLEGCICKFQSFIQILSSKVRIISTLSAMLHYFDAQKYLWRELVHPIETHIFYRSTFQNQGSEIVSQGVPVHFYFKIKELDISLTELSLDILLFVIGKLDLAGPFSVRASRILANCCKVENQSGLNLLCHFNDNQDVIVSRKQSSSILLRHLALADQPTRASTVSVQLLVPGTFSTSPIRLSLVEARVLAWRTRIVSLQDARSYPGPFVVVDILRKTEDGFSIVVSPLIRIHNETQFTLELRFQRPQQKEVDSASLFLNPGDAIDDSMVAFDAINLSGGLRKALMSLNVGNFLFSFRPEIADGLQKSRQSILVEWSDNLKGGKAVRLSGIFDKLSYKVQKDFSVEPGKCSFSTTHCSLHYEDACSAGMHFLIQSIRRKVPVVPADKFGDVPEGSNSAAALQEQKEIFLLPTVRVSNLLQLEIHVLLTETDECMTLGFHSIGNEATIPCGSAADLYANPASIYFTITLTAFSSSCKPVNSGECVKKLHKQKTSIRFLDIDLSFGGGKYFASIRFSRGDRGILEAAVFTPYTLKNDTDFSLLLFASNHSPTSGDGAEKFVSSIAPELGSYLPPRTVNSWFLRSNRLFLKLLHEDMYEALLDLDALSGLTEISLETEEAYGFKHTMKLGLSLGTSSSNVVAPSQTVTMVPRYIIFNGSEGGVVVRQCYLEDEMEGIISISSKQKATLQLRNGTSKRRAISFIDSIVRKHRSSNDDGLIFIQFRLNETEFGWSGPLCITSLGQFFLKFRRLSDIPLQQSCNVSAQGNSSMQSNQVIVQENGQWELAAVNVVEDGSSLVLHFHRPLNGNLPYRIENHLCVSSITYYQKDSLERDILGSGSTVGYAWDDLTLPHKLLVQINDVHLLREINMDKVRKWKPVFNFRQHKGLAPHVLLDKRRKDQEISNFDESYSAEVVKVGYEVYADGPTRVLRVSEFSDSHKEDLVYQSCAKVQLRVSHIALHLLERGKQKKDNTEEPSVYTPIVVARLGNISLESMFTDQGKYNQISIQSLNVDQKWVGAPLAAVLRRYRKDCSDTNDSILQIVIILLPTCSIVKQVRYSTIVLQPIELNLDEETLMRLVPFWRKSLSKSNTQSRQFYFNHFEIHPVKIVVSFLPGDSYTSYSTGQETLRSLLHSVIKIPAIKNMVVELNGVLVTHALITVRELFIKCAQHYSWYAMRAIYIAKGSQLLPPAFASLFDDLASSSLDVYFDPSHGLTNIPGLTLGTFKLISRCIHDKGFSGTKRYFGDLGKTLRTGGSNVLFVAVTEISDSVLKGAETSGFNGMVNGFHQGILKLAMEPSLLGTAFMEGGPDRKIKLDRSPGMDELYIEGYLQAMLDTIYKQEYLRVRIIDNQVLLKNLPPNSSLIDEIMDRVKGFLVSKALLKGESSTTSHPLHHLRGESEWKVGPTVLTLCEHLFVSFAIRILRKQAGKLMGNIKRKKEPEGDESKASVPAATTTVQSKKVIAVRKWGIGKFVLSGMLAYIDGRLCRCIPNPIARRIVSGFLLSFLDKDDTR